MLRPLTLCCVLCVCGRLTSLPPAVSAAEPTPKVDAVSVGTFLRIEGGTTARQEARCFVPLEVPAEHLGRLRLTAIVDGREKGVASQVEPGEPARLWWIAAGRLAPGATRIYRLDLASEPADTGSAGVVARQVDGYLDLQVGEHPVLRYNAAHVTPPPGVDPKYGRSAHIHAARTPSGAIVTDEFPPDHLHQSGLFLAYTKTEFQGRTPNFWDLLGGTGRVRFQELEQLVSGPVYGELRVQHEHVDLSGPQETVALREEWSVRVWNVGGPPSGYWICDIASTARCAGESPLKIREYHYGGMALRGARSWGVDQGRFVTSEGKDRLAGNHSRPRWCDLSGPVGDQTAGITFMTHPDNFRYPEPLRIHPTMQYMVYTPAQLGDWEIAPGQTHRSRYRFVFHDHQLPVETAERLWHDFASPLAATRTTAP